MRPRSTLAILLAVASPVSAESAPRLEAQTVHHVSVSEAPPSATIANGAGLAVEVPVRTWWSVIAGARLEGGRTQSSVRNSLPLVAAMRFTFVDRSRWRLYAMGGVGIAPEWLTLFTRAGVHTRFRTTTTRLSAGAGVTRQVARFRVGIETRIVVHQRGAADAPGDVMVYVPRDAAGVELAALVSHPLR